VVVGSNPAAPTIKYFEFKDLEACLVAGFFGSGGLSSVTDKN